MASGRGSQESGHQTVEFRELVNKLWLIWDTGRALIEPGDKYVARLGNITVFVECDPD